MFVNARKYYVENVLPSYQDFIEHRESNDWGENQLLRKGIVAATSLFHLREHIPTNIQPSKANLKSQYPDYRLIADIANVSKHHELTCNNPQISNASQIYESLRLIEFTDKQGEYVVPQLEVYVKLDNGTEIKLINILYNVMSIWLDVLDNLGIINQKPLEPLKNDFPISREEANKRRANLRIRQGEEYQWQFRIEKYNYNKRITESIDLTGKSIQFRIRELPENAPISIHIANPGIGVDFEVDFDIPLSKEQAKHYIILCGSEKEEFLKELMESTPDIKKELQSKIQSAIQAQIPKSI